MIQDKKVTIILPVCKDQRFLGLAIKSCLKQTHENIELIIIDCSGSKKIKERINSFGDDRIKYYTNDSNCISHCLNTGFNKSGGDFITWTSSEHYFHGTAIKKMLTHLIKNNERCVYTSFFCFNNGEPEEKALVRMCDTGLMAANCFACFLFDREVFKKTGLFDTNLDFNQSYDYILRIADNFNISFLDEPLSSLRLARGSLSSSDLNNFRYTIELILVKYKNGLASKSKTLESLMDTGIKYIADNLKGSFILDFALKNPSIYKSYMMQKIDEILLRKYPEEKRSCCLKKDIEEIFMHADSKLSENNYKELKKISVMIISQIIDSKYKRMAIKELMKLLLEKGMQNLFGEFKALFNDYIKKDYILSCNISGLEFNHEFKKSEIKQDLILMEADLAKGIFNEADDDIKKEFFSNLAWFKKNKPGDYYFHKLKEEFSVSYLYRDSEDVLSLLDFFNNFSAKKYIYEKALSLATDNAAILNVQNKIQELYSNSLKK